MKKHIKIGLFSLMFLTSMHVSAQIKMNSNSSIERGLTENYDLKRTISNDGRNYIEIKNAKNALYKIPREVPEAFSHPGFDNPSDYFSIDRTGMRKLIASVVLQKVQGDYNPLFMVDYYFSPVGDLKEVSFVITDGEQLNVVDFEKIESLLLKNVKISSKVKENPFLKVNYIKYGDMFRLDDLKKLQ